MRALNREDLANLARHMGWPAISLTMPLRRPGGDVQGDRIRLKNLLRTAEEQLTEGGMRPSEIKELMAPAWAFHDDPSRWRSPSDGLAMFMTHDTFEVFRTRLQPEEQVVVATRFQLRQVVPEMHHTGAFFVLALSKKQVRLFRGDAEEIHELDTSNAPKSLAEALNYDDFESHVQFHSGTPSGVSGRTRRAAMFHGHGGSADTAKTGLVRYFQLVDKGIHDMLKDERAPLVLAGVDYLLAIYRSVSTYAHLVETPISGNPDDLSAADFHSNAMEVLAPHFGAELNSDLERLNQREGTNEASRDLREIVTAAHAGRVDVLFVEPTGAQDWGLYDPSSGLVELHQQPLPGDFDLTDLAAAETLLHGGVVHALTATESSQGSVALFRF